MPDQKSDRFAYGDGDLVPDLSGATGKPLVNDDDEAEEPPKTINVHLPEEDGDDSDSPHE